MSGVPYIFANATTSIPLSELDSNFATPVTIGTTTVGLGNTVTTLAGLSNVSTTVTNTSNVSANTSLLLQTNGGTTAVTLDTNQNMGLGVTPSAWGTSGPRVFAIGSRGSLVDWSSSQQTDIWSNGYFNGTNSIYITTANASIYRQSSGQHQWYNAPSGTAGNAITFTQAMTLQNNGVWLLGTTSQLSNGLASVYQGSSGCAIEAEIVGSSTAYSVYTARVNNTANLFHAFYYNSYASGVGTISTNGTSTAYNTTSDYRLKNVTGTLTGYKERIMALLPKQGTWIADGSEFKGFLAHEFQTQYPTLVTGQKDAVDAEGKPVYQGMQAGGSETIADLVAFIQELSAQVTTLQAQVIALQAKVGT
jgi:hypothetical protein